MVDAANNCFYDNGIAKAREGMNMIRPYELEKGTVIYRYYDSARAGSAQEGANGPWWVEFEYFQKIKHFAAQHGYRHGYAARLFAAVLYEWSAVDAYVACTLKAPMKAWKGRGKQVASTGKDPRDTATMTPMQGALEIYQLCVPGLGGPLSMSPFVLEVLRDGPV